MKQDIIYEILKKLKTTPNLMRKIKIFVAVGVLGVLVTGALTIWAGVAAFNYVATKTSEIIHSPTAQAQVENLKLEAKALTKFQPLSCWAKAQSLIAIEPWLARPALDNLMNLMAGCLSAPAQVCEGRDCTQMNKAQGELYDSY